MQDNIDDDLSSGNATFTPRLALLNLPTETDDPNGLHALHEMAHAQTFAGTNFYAAFATRVLKGEDVSMRPLAPFLEIVPEIFGRAGARTTPGTTPNKIAAAQLHKIVISYRNLFDGAWKSVGLDPDGVTSPAATFAGVKPSELFNRTVILRVVQIALELAIVGAGSRQPEDHVAALCDRLARRTRIILPVRGMTLNYHLELLMLKPQRQVVGMFDNHFRLIDVLRDGDRARLTELRPLLSAVVCLEYFTQSWVPAFDTLFFAHQTMDGAQRMMAHVETRPMTEDGKAEFSRDLITLRSSIDPTRDGCRIVVAPEHREDFRLWNTIEILSLRSYIAALPTFLARLLQNAGLQSESARKALAWMSETSGEAASAYLSLIAKKTKRPELLQTDSFVRFQRGKDAKGNASYLLYPSH